MSPPPGEVNGHGEIYLIKYGAVTKKISGFEFSSAIDFTSDFIEAERSSDGNN
jgi:hypothetical protein